MEGVAMSDVNKKRVRLVPANTDAARGPSRAQNRYIKNRIAQRWKRDTPERRSRRVAEKFGWPHPGGIRLREAPDFCTGALGRLLHDVPAHSRGRIEAHSVEGPL